MRILKTMGCLAALALSGLAQTTSTISITGIASLTSLTSYGMNGSATLTGLGSALLSVSGSFDGTVLSGQTTGAVPGSFTLIFSDGAVMYGNLLIPSGVLIPQLGGTTSSTGSIQITGGTGRFAGARGRWGALTGSGTAASSTSASISVNGTGTLSYGQSVLPQFVYGGGWYTALYFSNSNTAPVTFQVNFVADNGTALNVPALGGSSYTVTISPGGTVRLEAPNSGPLVQGYASGTLPEGVTGYGVFRQSVVGVPDQEAVVPLANGGSTSASITFDDSNYITAAAVVNPSDVAVTVTVTATSLNGGALGTATIALPPHAKTAVVLRSLPGLNGVANSQGTATFTVTTGSVAVLGLRFYGSAFTSIPAVER